MPQKSPWAASRILRAKRSCTTSSRALAASRSCLSSATSTPKSHACVRACACFAPCCSVVFIHVSPRQGYGWITFSNEAEGVVFRFPAWLIVFFVTYPTYSSAEKAVAWCGVNMAYLRGRKLWVEKASEHDASKVCLTCFTIIINIKRLIRFFFSPADNRKHSSEFSDACIP
jgi:hypothetical protein